MATPSAPRINIGIDEADRAAIVGGLSKLLADTYTLYLTTHNFHWNVTGPMFNTLHLMFMTQYTELWNAVDPVAERIRSLGHPAPGSYAQFGRLSSIKDVPEDPPKALEMVADPGRRPRGGRAHGARHLPARREGRRRADRRPADPAPRHPRADRLDAAQPARVAPAGQSSSSMCFGQLLLSRRDSARSARTLPPVWQRAQ